MRSWFRSLVPFTAALLLAPASAAGAQQACKSGVRCGDKCIPANTECRLGVSRDQAKSNAPDSTDSARVTPTAAAVAVPAANPERAQTKTPVAAAQRGYHRDARGRCYTFNSRGRRVQVDRRLCE